MTIDCEPSVLCISSCMSYILRNWKYQIRQLAILMKFFFFNNSGPGLVTFVCFRARAPSRK